MITVEQVLKGREALMGGSVGGAAPFTVSRAFGSEIWDTKGKRYIDCTAQAWSLNVGHSHPAVIRAVTEHLKNYSHMRSSVETEPKLLLAAKLVQLAPENLKKVAFTLSGSEAVEGAMKLALKKDFTTSTFVSLFDGYHGRTLATMGLSWPHPSSITDKWHQNPVIRVPQGYCYRCPVGKVPESCNYECVDAAEFHIKKNVGSAPPAAMILEPIQGNGGMITFKPGYLGRMQKMARRLGMLFILDEIQTGMGRCGQWFYSTGEEQIKPDIMVIGKGLGGGFPLFGTMIDTKTVRQFDAGDHSFTFGHFSPSMVAALATIEVIEKEGLLDRAARMGAYIKERLLQLKEKYEFIGDVRGDGLMIGVEIVKGDKYPAPILTHEIIRCAFSMGVILGESKYGGLGNVLKIKPPLNISYDLVYEVFEALERIFSKVKGDMVTTV